ncbi:Transcription antitermination protein NusG [Candidatus Syntrophocurvum alkaliphilum]|uniref:Transcription termination/antitermination protein NusG n=1 Tax=Candidatus Syntrophocurvum alkaliphilum TaxID=2293317 RepID=A0A6I6DIV2_9FIRM|nr:transcription termination/antitermination protein NusG [Candidatus Syntrophocurvum alkaliphilum]QGU00764.1 Transcription antitermination protein NusG [Candidatus Syntrophocurvum alkaliphilum]
MKEPLENTNTNLEREKDLTRARKGDWYVVHTYSGYENKIKVDLTKRVESMNMQDKIFDVIVPEEQEVEYKAGKRKVTNKRVFPGYVIVNMIMDEESWYVVRHTPGITGFVGSGTKPIPLQQDEVDKILEQMGLLEKKPKKVIDVDIGDNIRVKSGPFANFEGVVKEILADRGKVRVNISMFGRDTPVELDYEQLDKL